MSVEQRPSETFPMCAVEGCTRPGSGTPTLCVIHVQTAPSTWMPTANDQTGHVVRATPRENWCAACDDPQGNQRWSPAHDAWFCVKCWQRINESSLSTTPEQPVTPQPAAQNTPLRTQP